MDHETLKYVLIGVACLFALILAGGTMVCVLGGFTLLDFCRTVCFCGQEVASEDSESTDINRLSLMNRLSIRRHRDSEDSDYWPSGYYEYQLEQMNNAATAMPSEPSGAHLPRRGRSPTEAPLPERAAFPSAGLTRISPKKKEKRSRVIGPSIRPQSPLSEPYSPDISMHSLPESRRPLLPMPSLDVMPGSSSNVPEAGLAAAASSSLSSSAAFENTQRTEIRRPVNAYIPARHAGNRRNIISPGHADSGAAADAGHVADGGRTDQDRRASMQSAVSTEWQTEYDE